MKLLVLFLISFSCLASYTSKQDAENCNKVGRTFYLRKAQCGPTCVKVPKNYSCETFSEQDVEVDDYSKPSHSKSEVEACDSEEDCKAKLALKECSDESERKYINAEYSEMYCSKFLGYDKKMVKKYLEDAAKKAAYDQAESDKVAVKKAKMDEVKLIILKKLKNGEELTPAQVRKFRIFMLRNLQ